jgi:HSP20 family molecular chaperone IbpA
VDETNSLIIQGKNSFQEPKNPIMRQYNVGDYYRAFQLSDQYDKEKISAKFENGLLEITIPRKEESKPRKIEITA